MDRKTIGRFNIEDIPEDDILRREKDNMSWCCYQDPRSPDAIYLKTNFIGGRHAYRFQAHRDKNFCNIVLVSVSIIHSGRFFEMGSTFVADPYGSPANIVLFVAKEIVEILQEHFDVEGVEEELAEVLLPPSIY